MARTHGTRSSYEHGCRCDECRAAKAKASRDYNRQRPDVRHAIRHTVCPECGGTMTRGNGAGRDPERCVDCYRERRRSEAGGHGTTGSYKRGCRCDECRAANAAHHRDYMRRRRSQAARGGDDARTL